VAIIQDEKRREDALKAAAGLLTCAVLILAPAVIWGESGMKTVDLPRPKTKGAVSVEEAISKRRSVRSYSSRDISAGDVSQLLWACQGITGKSRGLRAAPSAGALYPLEIYIAKKDGLFRYIPEGHKLEPISMSDLRGDLAAASYGQGFVRETSIVIVICAIYERVTSKYGERGVMYTHMEAGHAAQNVFLQAVSLGLDSVPVGAFSDKDVSKILGLPSDTKPLYILPVGYKRDTSP
jgi:SagB-type dehydrogenase family enzyme